MNIKNFFLVISILLITSCSATVEEEAPIEEKDSFRSIELFLSRASLGDSEFEHYKLVGKNLFRECGKMPRGKPVVTFQRFEPITVDSMTLARRRVLDLLVFLESGEVNWEKPGNTRSLVDPGKAKLTIDATDGMTIIDTSLDSLVDPRTKHARYLKKVTEAFRAAAGSEMCGNKHFYGLGYLQ